MGAASSITGLLPYIINGGVALIVLILVILRQLVPGWLYSEKQEEIQELKRALEMERDRSDAAVAGAAATRDILLSLRGRIYDEGTDNPQLRGRAYDAEVARRVAETPKGQ